jgi:hypothetical protein
MFRKYLYNLNDKVTKYCFVSIKQAVHLSYMLIRLLIQYKQGSNMHKWEEKKMPQNTYSTCKTGSREVPQSGWNRCIGSAPSGSNPSPLLVCLFFFCFCFVFFYNPAKGIIIVHTVYWKSVQTDKNSWFLVMVTCRDINENNLGSRNESTIAKY